MKQLTIDTTQLDRSNILRSVRNGYRAGYTRITIYSKNIDTPYLRKADKRSVQEVIREETSKLIDATVKIENKNTCTIIVKDNHPIDIFQIITDGMKKLVQMNEELILLFKGHLYNSPLLEEGHNTITKLMSYGIRQMNRSPGKWSPTYMHIFGCIDKIADYMKYITRDYMQFHQTLSSTAIKLFNEIHECLLLCNKIYKNPSNKLIAEFSIKRDDLKRHLQETTKNIDSREAYILGQSTGILEILVELAQFRKLLEYL